MAKVLTILLLALVMESVGVVLLNQGVKQVGEPARITPWELVLLVQRGATNPRLLLGVLFEAIFFGALLYLMAQADVSFLWPLTAMGFVLTTLAAKFILHESVSALRWSGVVLIMLGAGLITWSENQKKLPAPPSVPPAAQDRANH